MAIRDTAAEALEAEGFELSVLFLIFLGINLAWECTLAVLKFFDDVFFGRGSLWIDRVKEEILGLGVISLVLIFLEPELLKICVPDTNEDDDNSWETEGPDLSTAGRRALLSEDHHPCPPGKMHLFPKVIITASHFLLFYIAVVHIIYTFISFSLTLRRFRSWLAWEQKARTRSLRQRYHLGAFASLEHEAASNLPLSRRVHSGAAGEGPGLGPEAAPHQGPGAAGGQNQASNTRGAAAAAAALAPYRRCWAGCSSMMSSAWAVLTGALDAEVFSGLRDLFLTKAVLTMHVDGAPALPAGSKHEADARSAPEGSGGADPKPQDQGTSRTPSHLVEAVPPSVVALPPLSIADLRALHSLHFTNAAEQLVEVELTQVWAHAWALALFTAIFMLFPQQAWQAVWISGLSVILTIIIVAKMSAVLHEAALLGSTWPQQLQAQHVKRQQREQQQQAGRRRWWQRRRRAAADLELGSAPPGTGSPSQVEAASPPAPPPAAAPPAPAYTPDSALQALNSRASRLLWFRHTMPLLWLINIAFVINSLSITIAIYYLVAYQGNVTTGWDDTLQTWIPLLVADTALALYLGAVVVPQYALVSACCGHSHASLMRILRSSRRLGLEQEERGVSGLLLGGLFRLKQLCQSCMGRIRHRASGQPAAVSQRGELALLSSGGAEVLDVFIRGLAYRAGVILPHGHTAFSAQHRAHLPAAHAHPHPHPQPGPSASAWSGHPPSVLPLYREMARVWLSKLAATGALQALDPDCMAAAEISDWGPSAEVTSALAVLREAFSVIDQDSSGSVTLMELRERLVEVLRVKPTTNELRCMIQLIDIDSNKRISVREMCVFCAHEFFSTDSLHPGAIDAVSLHSSLQALGLPPSCYSDVCVHAMLAYAAGEEELAEYRARSSPPPALGLFRFSSLFWDLTLLD